MKRVIAISMILLVAGGARAVDWPQFCGSERNNSVGVGAAPESFSTLWTVENNDEPRTSPTVVGDYVYWADDGGYVTCVDKDTGENRWLRQLSNSPYWAGTIQSSPAVVDTFVFVGGGWNCNRIFCLHTDDGEVLWDHALGSESYDDVAASPTVAGGNVFIGSDEGYFVRLTFEGDEVWRWYENHDQIWSEAVVDVDGGRVYFGSMQDHVFCLPFDDPDGDGTIESDEVLWIYDAGNSIRGAPTLWGDRLYVTDQGGSVHCLDKVEGDQLWKFTCSGAIYGGATVSDDGRVYWGSRDDRVYCVDAYTGDYYWWYGTDGNIDCTPTLADGKLYVAASSNDWDLYCLDAENGELICVEHTYSYMESSPTVVDGVLYIGETSGDEDYMVALVPESGQCSTQSTWLAADAFPECGEVDLEDLSRNNVRFDMAASIAAPEDYMNDPGDSVVACLLPPWGGETLSAELHYRARFNPLFDAHRTAGLPAAGSVPGIQVGDSLWAFDLPDSGFLFPGDVLHYYIEGTFQDTLGGLWIATLPRDTTGFSCLPGDLSYNPAIYPHECAVRCLPGLVDEDPITSPSILLWIDTDEPTVAAAWLGALGQLGYQPAQDYDVFRTNGAGEAVGNGLGGRASVPQLAHYETILYAGGSAPRLTLGDLDGNGDVGRDLEALDGWLMAGPRNLLLSGSHLASDLQQRGTPAALTFLGTVMGVACAGSDVASYIGNQTSPTVAAEAGNPVFTLTEEWALQGGGARPRTFDAVTTAGGGQRIAEFLSAGGAPGVYLQAAAVLNVPGPFEPYGLDDDVITLPYDLSWASPADKVGRLDLLADILAYFGHAPGGPTTAVPPRATFTLGGHPNPFNPRLTISWQMPAAGPLDLRIHDLRGRLVRVLHDGPVPVGAGTTVWDGRDGHGRDLASGTYFVRAVGGGRTLIRKVTLLR